VTDVKAARAALDELTQVLDWLAASLLPGTTKPYRAPQMSAEKRAELDQVARHENALARRQKARSENVRRPTSTWSVSTWTSPPPSTTPSTGGLRRSAAGCCSGRTTSSGW
jgi:hypothetical protein